MKDMHVDMQEAWRHLRGLLKRTSWPEPAALSELAAKLRGVAGGVLSRQLESIGQAAGKAADKRARVYRAVDQAMARAASSPDDLTALADAAGLGRLMIEAAICSTYDDCPRAAQSLSPKAGDVRELHGGLHELGDKIRYHVPTQRLKGADVHLVYSLIEPRGYSVFHCHPGDELMLVLQGSVLAELRESGISVSLQRGDLLHFYAEQAHAARNTGDQVAELLIMRFYQSSDTSARDEVVRDIEQVVREGCRPGAAVKELLRSLREEMTWAGAAGPSVASGEPLLVSDPVGLGRLLRQLQHVEFRGNRGHLPLDVLAKRAKERLAAESGGMLMSRLATRNGVYRLHHGELEVPVDGLTVLAELYEVSPMLFWNFVARSLRPAVVVRGSTLFGPSAHDPVLPFHERPDFRVGRGLSASPGQDIEFHVPCRRLAGSDVAAQFVCLGPGTESRPNAHPGSELLMPLFGKPIQVTVERDGAKPDCFELDPAKRQYLHFASRCRHVVENRGDSPATVFVVRFFEGPMAKEHGALQPERRVGKPHRGSGHSGRRKGGAGEARRRSR
jgi:quercetin dioxygenase-like cupin family protein